MFSFRQATALLWQPVASVTRTPIPWASRACRLAAGSRSISSSSHWRKDESNPSSPRQEGEDANAEPTSTAESHTQLSFQMPEPRLSLTFTCTVEACHTRSTHQFTRRSYERGIVIVQCPGCQNRHLIADHLGWFKESTKDGQMKTVEDLVRAKGEKVRRGRIGEGGVVEYAPE
ncbi:DNL zinc finger-domain-containing protein [Cubamyces lactineus]|nr:DNL zinc finger-domain-containing protein [Cubamyces lactineus]